MIKAIEYFVRRYLFNEFKESYAFVFIKNK